MRSVLEPQNPRYHRVVVLLTCFGDVDTSHKSCQSNRRSHAMGKMVFLCKYQSIDIFFVIPNGGRNLTPKCGPHDHEEKKHRKNSVFMKLWLVQFPKNFPFFMGVFFHKNREEQKSKNATNDAREGCTFSLVIFFAE